MEHTDLLKPVPEDWSSAMAVVAHPDDMEYGAASVVARWTDQGKQVVYLIVTRGEAGIDSMAPTEAGPLREAEEKESAAIVGVNTVEFLDFSDGVIEYGLPLRREIARAVRRHRPEVLITINHRLTFGGETLNMADHRNVGLAVLDAGRDAGNRWIFPELIQEGLEPWPGVKLALIEASPQPTHAVDVTDYFERGVKSLEAHRTYLQNLGDASNPAPMLRKFAAAIGKRFGCELAAPFEVIRI